MRSGTLQVGFNMRKVTRGGVVIKLWDLGGQVFAWLGGGRAGGESKLGEQ